MTTAQGNKLAFDADFDTPTNEEIANTIAEWEAIKLKLLSLREVDWESEVHGDDEEEDED